MKSTTELYEDLDRALEQRDNYKLGFETQYALAVENHNKWAAASNELDKAKEDFDKLRDKYGKLKDLFCAVLMSLPDDSPIISLIIETYKLHTSENK